jgi:hypothetical protein
MTDFKTKLTTAFATGAVLLNALVPMASAATITITENGAFSTSNANVNLSNSVNVDQNNDANIDNNVDVNADTGGNSASFNTGGNSDVTSGNVDTNVAITNAANQNHAVVESCCLPNVDVEISKNAAYANSDVNVDASNDVNIDQDNDADIDNDVDVDADTGDNTASFNTNGGSSVRSGNINSDVTIVSAANINSAVVGGGDNNGGGVLSAVISENGAFSNNDIDLNVDNDVNVDQNNDADIDNNVDINADTGGNSASFNAGDDVEVISGNVDTTVTVDNVVNFNAASIDDCGCLVDLTALIEKNGAFADSEITFDHENDLDVDQDNDADLDNDVDVDAETGDNAADFNTGDPVVTSGNVGSDEDSTVAVANTGNVNTYGTDDVEWDFDLGGIWEWFLSL